MHVLLSKAAFHVNQVKDFTELRHNNNGLYILLQRALCYYNCVVQNLNHPFYSLM